MTATKTKTKGTKAKKSAKAHDAPAKTGTGGAATKAKKLSALDAAAKVLGQAGQPMNCKELVEAMAAKGYWTSPGGKTPWATLYSAFLRELKTKGSDARFTKTERGKFGLTEKT